MQIQNPIIRSALFLLFIIEIIKQVNIYYVCIVNICLMSCRWFKQFLVFLSLFCILESTGISILSVLTKYKISQTDSQIANEDEGTSERNEAKENKLKEFWPGDILIMAPAVYISINKVFYPQEQPHAHLAWVPPVSTPPPNCIV
jgi:hypothetical protein